MRGIALTCVSSVGVCIQGDPGSVGFPFVDIAFGCGLCVLLSFLGRFFFFVFLLVPPFPCFPR